MDASEHALPYVEHSGIKFAKISVKQRAELLRKAKAAQRAALVSNVKESGLPADQGYVELSNFDSLIWGQQKWIQYVNDADGQEQIFRASVAKHHANEVDPIIDSLALGEVEELRLLCSICNLEFREAAPTVPNMKQVGVLNGLPIYSPTTQPVEGSDPNAAAPAPMKGYGQ